MKKSLCFVLFLLSGFSLFCQEVLKSYEEEYYDFLSLTGETSRSYINYRTLSDSVWTVPENHVWDSNNLGTSFNFFDFNSEDENFFLSGIDKSVKFRLYGPESFNSYNTAAPFGQNDGTLWQGRGYNANLTAGFNLKAFGFEATFKPQFSYSQNLDFDIMETKNSSGFGYWTYGCDALQRPGNQALSNFDWGDSEIRFNYFNFSVGFGTQAVWLGPAHENALLLSNNAAPFPKADLGLKRTAVTLPYLNWYLGDFEFRTWVGKLTESEYFDSDPANDHNQFSGFSFSWAVPHIQGLSFGFNKVCLCRWGDKYSFRYLNPFYALNVIKTSDDRNVHGEDQKASLNIDWLFEPVGFEIYSEIGVDDYPSKGIKFYEFARFPLHTITYTVGLKKSLDINLEKKLRGLINFEWNSTEGSRDYYNWPGSNYNFGTHGQILQGYTNRGQWLGSGIGYGGNSQYLSFTLYSPHGYDKFFIARNNPDNNYVYYKILRGVSDNERSNRWFTAYKANFYVGAETLWFLPAGLSIKGSMLYNLVINPLYNPGLSSDGYYREYTHWHNFSFNLSLKYSL